MFSAWNIISAWAGHVKLVFEAETVPASCLFAGKTPGTRLLETWAL